MSNEITSNSVKVFFVCPDRAMMPDEEYLKDLFLLGYEVHYLSEDRRISIEDNIDCLFSLFDKLIIFINIEDERIKQDWKRILEKICTKYKDKIRIGVTHHEIDEVRKNEIERYCNMDLGIEAGCLFLGYSIRENSRRIALVLKANNVSAKEQRKTIRVECPSGRLNFDLGGKKYECNIIDISISHFSCYFKNAAKSIDIQMYEKIKNIQIILGGINFVDAIMSLKRFDESRNAMIFVFCYVTKNGGKECLDKKERDSINSILFNLLHDSVDKAVLNAFREKRLEKLKTQKVLMHV